MKIINQSPEPNDAKSRRAIKPAISYLIDNLPAYCANTYQSTTDHMHLIDSIIVPPRAANNVDTHPLCFFLIVHHAWP